MIDPEARELIGRRFSFGTTVINCVKHQSLAIIERPDDCALCAADMRNALRRALRANDFLNIWKDEATMLLERDIPRPEVLVAREEQQLRLLPAATPAALHASALKLVMERAAEGYWYDGVAQELAVGIIQAEDGERAWEFLHRRKDNEYEWVGLVRMG